MLVISSSDVAAESVAPAGLPGAIGITRLLGFVGKVGVHENLIIKSIFSAARGKRETTKSAGTTETI